MRSLSRTLGQHLRGRRRPWQRNDARAVGILLIVIVGGLSFGAINAELERQRRTGEADITIEWRRFQPGRRSPDEVTQGNYMGYSYLVDGAVFVGATFRRWTNY